MNGQPIELTDWRGNKYTVGSLVLYPRTFGSSCEIAEATVLSITYRKHRGSGYWKPDGTVEMSVMILPKEGSRTQSIKQYRGRARYPVKITNTENLTAVPDRPA